MIVESFDTLASTPAAQDALGQLRTATGSSNSPIERHSLRCYHLAVAIAADRHWTIDEELLIVASMLHDIGLYIGAQRRSPYTVEGAELSRRLGRKHGWPDTRVRRCSLAVDRHHELRCQSEYGSEAESLRLADLVDLTSGGLRFGLDAEEVRKLNLAVARVGLLGELTRRVGSLFVRQPIATLRIFRRPLEAASE